MLMPRIPQITIFFDLFQCLKVRRKSPECWIICLTVIEMFEEECATSRERKATRTAGARRRARINVPNESLRTRPNLMRWPRYAPARLPQARPVEIPRLDCSQTSKARSLRISVGRLHMTSPTLPEAGCSAHLRPCALAGSIHVSIE